MLKEGVTELAVSEWASSVVLGPMKVGELRFCLDLKKLKAMAVRNKYRLPLMNGCNDSLRNATICSIVDCKSGYSQIKVPKAGCDKTTHSSRHGLFRLIRVSFRLKNLPVSFQRAVDKILSEVRWQFALDHLKDITVYSKYVTEHLVHVRTVPSLLRSDRVALKLSKCPFFADTVSQTGRTIRPGKLAVDKKSCEAVRKPLL